MMLIYNKQLLLFFYLVLLLSSCSINQRINGLWQIEKVSVADQEMTPIGRWTRFHKDNSQEAGNGWFQHTIGNWTYNPKTKQINLISSNGLKDEYGGFTIVEMDRSKMLWSRKEDGQNIAVHLKRIEKLPQSPANQLLGAWKSIVKHDDSVSYLFFRWDQIITIQQTNEKKKYGLYKAHGHKQELTIIHYETPLRQKTWTYRFEGKDRLTLSNEEEKLTFERVDHLLK